MLFVIRDGFTVAVGPDWSPPHLLVAALLVGDERGGASPLLAALRDAADMVMVVRDPDDARAVIAALR